MSALDAPDLLSLLHDESSSVVAAASRFGDADVAAPSECAGWTRGHVLSHLARHAEAVTAVLRDLTAGGVPVETLRAGGVVPGVRPVYAGTDERASDIDARAADPAAELAASLEAACASLQTALASLPPEAATAEVRRTPGGQVVPVSGLAFSRLREVVVHHCDLRTGDYDYGDIAAAARALLVDDTLARLARAGMPVVADGSGFALPDRRRLDETAPGGFLSWTLRQRTDGVRAADGGDLPVLPAV